jgi:hypothetical protein
MRQLLLSFVRRWPARTRFDSRHRPLDGGTADRLQPDPSWKRKVVRASRSVSVLLSMHGNHQDRPCPVGKDRTPAPHFEFPGSGNEPHHGDLHVRPIAQGPHRLEASWFSVMKAATQE